MNLNDVKTQFLSGWRDQKCEFDPQRSDGSEVGEEQRAWQVGKSLKEAYSLMRSADLVDYDSDVARVRLIVRNVREQYGADFLDSVIPDLATEPGFENLPITRYYVQHEGDANTPAVLLAKWEPDYSVDDLYDWCGDNTWTPRDSFEDLADDIEVSGPMSWFDAQRYLGEVIRAVPRASDQVECTCRPGWLSEYGLDPWCKVDEHKS